MELISIIVPVYNVQNYLEKCVDSLVAQTYEYIEILLVDDGSTDQSGAICDTCEKRFQKVRTFHKKNGGLSDARNYGLQYASGKYVIFVDSDDEVSETYVEYLYTLVKKYGGDIGISDCVHCYLDSPVKYCKERNVKIYDPEHAVVEMLYQTSFLVSACGKIYKKEFFDTIEFPKGMLYEDSAIMYKLFLQARKIVYGNAQNYAYFHRNGSITSQKFDMRNFDIILISKQIYNEFLKKDKLLKKAARSYLVVSALRVYLNCPENQAYESGKKECEEIIFKEGLYVLFDKKARLKTRAGVLLFFIARPFMRIIYKRVDRWK